MKKFIRVISVLLVLGIGLTTFGCGTKVEEQVTDTEQVETSDPLSEDSLVGTWKGIEGEISTLTLGNNGSYMDDAGEAYISGTYFLDAVSNTMTVNESEYGMTFKYNVSLDGKVLTLQLDGGLPRKFYKMD